MSVFDREFSRWMRLTDIYARLCARSIVQTPTGMSRLRRAAAAVANSEAVLSRWDEVEVMGATQVSSQAQPRWAGSIAAML